MDLKQFTLLIGVASLPSMTTASTVYRTISKVEAISVDCPVGTVPRLPNLVWVTYSDGYSEYRQVRWANAPLADEQAEADAQKHPAGSQYEIGGFVIGDETTDNGYPVKAQIKVVAEGYQTPEKEVAHTFSLADVSIDGDNRLTHNRDEAIREICSWDVTQQLYNYRDTYGLSTEGYTKSDGWDSPDTKLKGHGSGHYMSAIAQAYAVATNPEQKAILRKNITRMVNELRECQERTFVYNKELKRNWEARDFAPEAELREMKGTWAAFDEYKKHPELYGYGYINAIPAQHCALIEMYRAYNNSDWVWAPYYSVHKQLAGLIDIATYFDDKEICDKALLIAKDMGLWVWNRMHYRTYVKQDGTQDERRAKPGNRYEMWDMYIAGEVGGMSESLARLSEMVSNPDEKAKLLEAANCFDAPKFYDPLSKNIDDIRTRHANQHIPMIIGALRSYKSNQKPYYYNLAENFWRLVQGRYMYAMGGVGNGEMFRQPYTQILSMATNGLQEGESEAYPDINETCCAYNLVKLSKDLNCYNPDNAQYLDYIERTLYNQIIGSLNPDQYQTCYQYAVGLNATKPFGNETPQSTCCGGTGSENHTKYQQSAYFANDNTLWVGLYMPTTLHWKEKGVTIKQDCLWPAQHSAIKITEGEGDFTLKLRVPYWATQGFSIKVNGKEVAKSYQPSTYVELEQKHWKAGDVVEINMPFSKHIEYGADKLSSDVASLDGTPLKTSWVGTLMYGPLVMAGTGAQTWNQATLNIDSRLSNITVGESNGVTTGAGANLLTLKLDGKEFQPDYYRNANSTHYYRINLTDAKSKKSKKVKIDFTELNSLLNLAAERKADQEKWNALSQKVPEYAPWAPFGYERMQKVMAQAQELVAKGKKKVTQDELEGTTAILNRAINTMRPGNLAEMEDLRELSGLLRRAGWPDDNTSEELKDAISYGRMVQKYVTDGSGTHDMIHAAVEKLKKAMKQ
ncbi:beta-L-arabinofuranosidase domain-containing protein [Segatella copri]|uniref:beta-L-arabinofuranosidase domain-containing protein n=1 Tax=Segatella copri TaxID=165179 RepID=UPI001C44D8BD|nr:glycoside hydrolase family 127 protein [Segatella copri]